MHPRRWRLIEPRTPRSIEEVVELLLKNRGVDDSFLSPSLSDLEPYCNCCGMSEGAELAASHLRRGRKIVLVGDYDCDGVTATAQMALFLREIGFLDFEAVFPERAEGYGMPARAVLDQPEASLFIAMDCGTRDHGTIGMLRERGADCIVIDHHEVSDGTAAPASVLINPKQPGCPSAFKEMCSSGLTLLFLTRLRKALAGSYPSPSLGGKYLALAAIGTIADVVPLIESNRIIARSGLAALNAAPYPPLWKIAQYAGLAARKLDAGHVGFQLAPRINAAGRMASPRIAFELLVDEDPDAIDRGARALHQLNQRRQSEEEMILKDIAARFDESDQGRRTAVLADAAWPPGLVGILASRVQQELLYGPSVVLSVDLEAGMARGSARSVPGFDLHGALEQTSSLLLKWGGHKMAAGMTLSIDNLDAFREAFENVAAAYPSETFIPAGRIDMQLPLDLVDDTLLDALDRLEPYGQGNPKPTFSARLVRVKIDRRFGKRSEHFAMTVERKLPAVFWGGIRHLAADSPTLDGPVNIVFQLDRDRRSMAPLLTIKSLDAPAVG